MAAKNKMTVSVQPTAQRLTAAERRAARIGTLATQQATLKQEAADRRRKRAQDAEGVSSKSVPSKGVPGKSRRRRDPAR